MRAYGYVRVSSQDQGEHGTSLDGQQDEIRRWARERGLPDPEIRVEIESGSAERFERRVELHALLKAARPGDVVVVPKVDRWSRDLPWGVASVRDLVKRGVRWYSIGEAIDASTPQGDSTLGIMAWVADQERKRIRERTVGRRHALLEQGFWAHGSVPFGYQRKERTLDPLPAEAALVVRAFELAANGLRLADIQEQLRPELPTHDWSKTAISRMLRSRAYLGDVPLPSGEWAKGKHPALVSASLFAGAEAAMRTRDMGGRKPDPGSRTSTWLVRGEIAWCGACGARLRSIHARGRNYLACGAHCGASYAKVPELDSATSAEVHKRLEALRKALTDGPAQSAAPVKDFNAFRARVEQRRQRALALALEGAISGAQLREAQAKLDAERGKIDAEEAAQPEEPPEAARKAAAQIAGRLALAFSRAPVPVRRAVLHMLARRIVVTRGQPEIEWLPPDEVVGGPKGNA